MPHLRTPRWTVYEHGYRVHLVMYVGRTRWWVLARGRVRQGEAAIAPQAMRQVRALVRRAKNDRFPLG